VALLESLINGPEDVGSNPAKYQNFFLSTARISPDSKIKFFILILNHQFIHLHSVFAF